MRHYVTTTLAPDPAHVRGWRTIRAGSHRIRLALLPGGGTRAVSVLHPRGEAPNPSRHCSVCGRPGHDRRAHRGRRNPADLLGLANLGLTAIQSYQIGRLRRNPRRRVKRGRTR